ncbi:MAG TPA: hypothetical protein VM261_19605 [Kofleriaceae bacterium]|nr:hypothetical protein [Kofleriaceae bacterium]
MRGLRACVVGTEQEFFELGRHPWLRPTISLVDLSLGGLVRELEVRRRSLIAALAGIPTMLLDADGNDVPLFDDVVGVLPLGSHPDTVAQTIHDWAKR